MTQEALKLALEALQGSLTPDFLVGQIERKNKAITAIKEALAQKQEPVAYDKTEMNCFVQDLYDKKMKEGKHGHYETMFHVVHQAIKRVPPQRTWVGLTKEDMPDGKNPMFDHEYFIAGMVFAAKVLEEKNT